MAYRIKKEETKYPDLEIESNGEVKVYKPKISIDTVVKEYKDLKQRIGKIDNLENDNYYLELGAMLVQILNMVFDEEQTKDMVETYEGKYVELLLAVIPYLDEVIKPEVEKIKETRINEYQEKNEALRNISN